MRETAINRQQLGLAIANIIETVKMTRQMENCNRERFGEQQMVRKVTLNQFKAIVEFHIKNEIDIMKMMFLLDKKDVEEFNIWYNNHPYCKGIDEISDFVRGQGNRTNQK